MNAKRVVVLSIDALRASNLPCYGYDRDTAPFISSLAADNALFENCYSTSSHTREAMPSMLTGKYPLDAVEGRYELASETVGTRLDEPAGMFHSNPFISRAYGFDRGFDTFDDDLWLGRNRVLALARRSLQKLLNRHYARAETINERATQWIDRVRSDRFLLWNHYMDVHGPYQPPGAYRKAYLDDHVSNRRAQVLLHKGIRTPDRMTRQDRTTLRNLYDGEIRYLDDQVRAFVDELRSRDLYRDTLLIITADHGEGLGEDGVYEHPRILTEELLHVPLLLAGGGVPSVRVEEPVSVRDLPATVLAALGQRTDSVPGTDLWSHVEDRVGVTERPAFAQVTQKRSGDVAFYARTWDEVARAMLSPGSGEVTFQGRGDARNALEDHVTKYADGVPERVDAVPEDDEIERRLRGLGYLDDDS